MRSKGVLLGCLVVACHGSVESTEPRDASVRVDQEPIVETKDAAGSSVGGQGTYPVTTDDDGVGTKSRTTVTTSDGGAGTTSTQTNGGGTGVTPTDFTASDGTSNGTGTAQSEDTNAGTTANGATESANTVNDDTEGDETTDDTNDTAANTSDEPLATSEPSNETSASDDETVSTSDETTVDDSNDTSAESSTSDSATVEPDPSTVAPAIRASLLQMDLDESNLLPFAETLSEGDEIAHVPMMRSFEASLGECSSCHVTDYAEWTPAKYVSLHMWADIVTQFRLKDGGVLYCDSCHQGQARFLDRSNPEALEAWMQVNLVDKLERVDGEPHGCESCHGDPPNYGLIDAWSSG